MIFKFNNSNQRVIDFYDKESFEDEKDNVTLITNNWYTWKE